MKEKKIKVLCVIMPDGNKFYSDKIDMKQAAKSAKEYMVKNNIPFGKKPATEFQVLEMTKKEYTAIPATQDANSFWN